jgi:thiol:disulfide interchange protein DsbG
VPKFSFPSFSLPSRRLVGVLGGGALLSISAYVFSADNYPEPIQQAVDAGIKVEKTFPAASGMTGWVLSQGGQYSMVFTTPDRKTLVTGALIGEHGENLSSGYEEKYLPKPDLTALFQDLEKSAYVAEGAVQNPKKVIYVFADPNCPFCHNTWKALQPYEKAALQVRWLLVDTLGPTSMPKAIEVMTSPNTTAAFVKMEENQGKSWRPSEKASVSASPEAAASVRNNTGLMSRFGLAGTPGVIWKDAHGKANVKGGMPRLSELPGITGLPEQVIDDPALARFR